MSMIPRLHTTTITTIIMITTITMIIFTVTMIIMIMIFIIIMIVFTPIVRPPRTISNLQWKQDTMSNAGKMIYLLKEGNEVND